MTKIEIDQTLIGTAPTSVRDALHSAVSYFPLDLRNTLTPDSSRVCGEDRPVWHICCNIPG
jgi:hypothetical protein